MGDELSIVQVIQNIGFPMGITIYLLYRFEKKINKLEDAITVLTIAIKNRNGELR